MNRQREIGPVSSLGIGNQVYLIGQVSRDPKAIENDTPITLELILMRKQSGVSDLEVGTQIIELFKETS